MPRLGYRFVNHTADIEFMAYGASPSKLFRNAFLALFDTMAYRASVAKIAKTVKSAKGSVSGIYTFQINEKADSLEELAWLSLQDALSEADANGISPFGAEKITVKEENGRYLLHATVSGMPQDTEHRKFDVKGISRFSLKFSREKGRYAMSVVLDV